MNQQAKPQPAFGLTKTRFFFSFFSFKPPSSLLPYLLLFGAVWFAPGAWAEDPFLTWRTYETQHFRIHYQPAHGQQAQQTADIAETYYPQLTRLLAWQPERKTEILLTDAFDFANGNARPFPYNLMVFYLHPPVEGTLIDYQDWLRILFIHEFTHVLHLDRSAKAPKELRKFVGRVPLLFPNAMQPAWFIEGLATYYETDVKAGVGRGQATWFDSLMRNEVLEGFKPVRQVHLRQRSWPLNSAYLYGVYFFQFLEARYGQAVVERYIADYSDNLVPFLLDRNARRATGVGLESLWDAYAKHVINAQQRNIQRLREQPLSPSQAITNGGYFNGQPCYTAAGEVLLIRDNAEQQAALVRWSPEQGFTRLAKVNRASRFDYHPKQFVLLAQADVCDRHNYYYDLYHLDAAGKMQRLTHCQRYRFARWSPDGQQIAAIRILGGLSYVDLLDAKGTKIRSLFRGKPGQVVASLAWHPQDNYLLLTQLNTQARQPMPRGWEFVRLDLADLSLARLPLAAGDTLLDPSFDEAGYYLYFSANPSGVFNIKRLDLRNDPWVAIGEVDRQEAVMEAENLSHTLGGFFQPAVQGNRLLVQALSGQGFDIQQLSLPDTAVLAPTIKPALEFNQSRLKTHRPMTAAGVSALASVTSQPQPALKPKPALEPKPAPEPTTGEPSAPRLQPLQAASRPYRPYRSLRPRYWLPIALADSERLEYGVFTSGHDVLEAHAYSVQLTYETQFGDLFADAIYGFDQRWFVRWRRTADAEEGRFGELDLLQYSTDAQLIYQQPFLSWRGSWTLAAAYVHERDRYELVDLDSAEVIGELADTQANLLGVGLGFDNSETYVRSISKNNGRQLRLVAETRNGLDNDFELGNLYQAEWREFIGLGGQHLLAARGLYAHASDASENLELGGVRSDEIPGPVVQFNRREFPLRGFDDDLTQLNGDRLALLSLEWRFPLRRVERNLLWLPLGLQQLSGKLFGDAGSVWQIGEDAEHWYTGSGVELIGETQLAYALNINLRLGFARGHQAIGDNQFYFSLGGSF